MSEEFQVDLEPVSYVHYDDTGVIVSRGSASNPAINMMEHQGQKILRLTGVPPVLDHQSLLRDDQYVDLAGDKPVLKYKQKWRQQFVPPTVPVGQEAVLPGLPPCRLSFTGPVSGYQDQTEVGDAHLGFTIPGTYAVTFTVFPYLPAELTLEVTK